MVEDHRQETLLATQTVIQDVAGLSTFRVYELTSVVEKHANFIFAQSASVPVEFREPFNNGSFFVPFPEIIKF